MANSQNGYAGITSGSDPRLAPLRWITGKVLAGNVATVFDHLGARFNAEVEPINKAASWGWNYRAIRGATSLSNHASGTAVDFNAPAHPLGKVGTFGARAATVRAIVADINRLAGGALIRWGGDYSGRKDEMHFEVIGSPQMAARAATAILGGAPAPAAPAPAPAAHHGTRNPAVSLATQKAVQGAKPDAYWGDDTDMRVNLVRFALNGQFPGGDGRGGVQGVKDAQWVCFADADGKWGPKSAKALIETVKRLQRAWGVKPDGVWGAKTEAAWVAARTANYKTW